MGRRSGSLFAVLATAIATATAAQVGPPVTPGFPNVTQTPATS